MLPFSAMISWIQSMLSPVKSVEMADEWLRFTVSCSQMNVAAAEVFARRTLRIIQGQMTLVEAIEITLEKASVMAIAFEKAGGAMVRGADPVQIAHAAIQPIRDKTLENARLLRR